MVYLTYCYCCYFGKGCISIIPSEVHHIIVIIIRIIHYARYDRQYCDHKIFVSAHVSMVQNVPVATTWYSIIAEMHFLHKDSNVYCGINFLMYRYEKLYTGTL